MRYTQNAVESGSDPAHSFLKLVKVVCPRAPERTTEYKSKSDCCLRSRLCVARLWHAIACQQYDCADKTREPYCQCHEADGEREVIHPFAVDDVEQVPFMLRKG